jgi:hypothetical protein
VLEQLEHCDLDLTPEEIYPRHNMTDRKSITMNEDLTTVLNYEPEDQEEEGSLIMQIPPTPDTPFEQIPPIPDSPF